MILRTVPKALFSTALILSAVLLLLTSTVGSQSLTTITSWTTATGGVTSTSYRTFAVATTSITSMSTSTSMYSFAMPAVQPRHCYYDYTLGTFSTGERLVGQAASSIPIDFFVMSKDQYNDFSHGTCDQEYSAYVKSSAVTSYSLNWVVPSDGDYYFVFFNNPAGSQGTSKATGSFSLQLTYSQLVTSTIYSKAGTTIQSVTTRTMSSLYYSTVGSSLGGITSPVSLVVIGVVAVILVVIAVVAIRKRQKRPVATETKPSEVSKEKRFCINCGAELPTYSKFCNKCGSAQS
jgi:hypothetical protein